MKRNLVIFIFVLFVSSTLLSAQTISLAVTSVEAIGVEQETARLVEQLLQTEFSKLPFFHLVERNNLKVILEEQQLQLSGITNAATAARLGTILNVQKIVFGSIGRYDSSYIKYMLSLRLVDVEKGSVELAESIQIRNGDDLAAAVSNIVKKIGSRVELSGKVTGIDEGFIYTSVGELMGVEPGDLLSIYRIYPIKDDQDNIIMREEIAVANLVVEMVSIEGSKCRLLESGDRIEVGDSVRLGSVNLEVIESKGSLTVESIPEGSHVFLNSEFIGVTPLKLTGLEPGKYEVEIRAAGHQHYLGRVNISEGRNVTLNRELEREIEIEDLILLGKIPRKSTDPRQAMKAAWIPGQGYVYNGYKNMGYVLPGTMIPILLLMADQIRGTMQKKQNLDSTDVSALTDVWDRRSYYEDKSFYDQGLQTILIGGSYLLSSYIFSIIDARSSAKDDFLYPTFLEVSTGWGGAFTGWTQTDDTQIPFTPEFTQDVKDGISSFYGGGYIDFAFKGRKLYASIGLAFGGEPIYLEYLFCYRFQITENLFLGPGIYGIYNTTHCNDWDYAEGGKDVLKPLISSITSPLLSLSYISSSWEMDLYGSPWTTVAAFPYVLSGTTAYSDQTSGINGFFIGTDIAFFFNRITGIRLSSDYHHAWNTDEELVAEGFSTVDKMHYLQVKLGLVFRF